MVGEREEKEEASAALDRIRAALSGLRFGTVTAVSPSTTRQPRSPSVSTTEPAPRASSSRAAASPAGIPVSSSVSGSFGQRTSLSR